MAIYGSMFKGDKSGPLSQEEIVALYKKFRLSLEKKVKIKI